jgi:hypothetical protein
MADTQKQPEPVTGKDIVFECPHCTKSLAIDCRGAGLAIVCPDCGQNITVPIPAGVDLTDLDQLSATEAGVNGEPVAPPRAPRSPEEMRLMLTELEELRFRRRYLEKQQAAAAKAILLLQDQVIVMRQALEQAEAALANLQPPSAGETRSL